MNISVLKQYLFKNSIIYKNGYVKIKCKCPVTVTSCITSNNYSTNNNKSEKRSLILEIYKRWCSSTTPETGPPSNKLPPLMNFPEIVWPSLIKSVRNFISATFIIKPYLDREFNFPDFVQGSKQALQVVSSRISEGDVKSLNGYVSGEIIPKIQSSISLMSLPQREQIAIDKEDIYFSFPYQVGIIFDDHEDRTTKDQKRFVEITMVFHTLKGLAAMRTRGEEPPINMGMMPEYQKRISICNYRFIREYTKGFESDWTINLLNHFKPSDQLEEGN